MHLRSILILAVITSCSHAVPELSKDAGVEARPIGSRAIPFIPHPHDGSAPVVPPDATVPWIPVTRENASGKGIPASWVQVLTGKRLDHRMVWVDPDSGLIAK